MTVEAEYDVILTIGSVCIFIYILGIIELIRLRDSVFIRQTVPTINICICVNYIINTITAFFTTKGSLSCPIYLWAGFINVLPTINGFYILGLRWIIVDRIANKLLSQLTTHELSLESSLDANNYINKGGSSDQSFAMNNQLMVEVEEITSNRQWSIINWLAKKKNSGSARFTIKLYFISFGISLIIPLIINIITPQYQDFNQLCEERTTIEVIFLIVIFIVAIVLFIYDLVKLRKIKDEYGFKVMLSGAVITWTFILLIFSGISVLDDPIMHSIYKFFSVFIFVIPFGFLVGYPLFKHYRIIGFWMKKWSDSDTTGTGQTGTDVDGRSQTEGTSDQRTSDSEKTEFGKSLAKTDSKHVEVKSQLMTWIEYQLPSSTERPGFESLRVFAARYDSSIQISRFYRHALSFYDSWNSLKKRDMATSSMAVIMYQKYIKTADGRDAFCPMIINPTDLIEIMELWNEMDKLHKSTTIADVNQIETIEDNFVAQMNMIHKHTEKRLMSELFERYKISSFYNEVVQNSKFNAISIV